tara:strand:- start:658 stop:1002 length:345 start_codon:yes stop_codon:yes gene_type:complete
MAAGTYNITIIKGTDFSIGMTLTDNSASAINVTNYTFKSEIRRKASTGIDATFTITKTNATAGAIKLALTQAQTNSLPVGKLQYDLLAHDGTEVSQYIKGTVTVVDTVTDGISL